MVEVMEKVRMFEMVVIVVFPPGARGDNVATHPVPAD